LKPLSHHEDFCVPEFKDDSFGHLTSDISNEMADRKGNNEGETKDISEREMVKTKSLKIGPKGPFK
jgi:hypothetical protein